MNYATLYRATILLVILFLSAAAFAQADRPLISVQGTLKDINGVTVADGQRAFIFKLYTVEIAGTPLWEEVAQVEVNGGIYSHNLGSVTLLDESLFARTVYLGINVDGNELSPRTTLTYSPYALSVAAAQRIARGGCSGQVGDVKYSILNPAQFAEQNGDCWVPMDGASMSGSILAGILGTETVPDIGGTFIRSQEFATGRTQDGDGRDANSPIATLQEGEISSHNHVTTSGGAHDHSYRDSYLREVTLQPGENDRAGSIQVPPSGTSPGIDTHGPGGFGMKFTLSDNNGRATERNIDPSHAHDISNTGGSETRPVNVNLYTYIRIN